MTDILILASKSPRRKELLDLMGIPYKIIVSNADENAQEIKNPKKYALEIARRKCNEVYNNNLNDTVISADTIVFIKNKILGKPANNADTKAMLTLLSGEKHFVITGVVVKNSKKEISFVEKTAVYFNKLSSEEINRYVASGEPADKAGAYAIQGLGSVFVRRIKGDYSNVVGLPVSRLYKTLATEFNLYPNR